jgi:hypothetical protein
VGSAWLITGAVVLWVLLTGAALRWVWHAAGWSFWWSPEASVQQVEVFRGRAWSVGLVAVGLPLVGAGLARRRGYRNAAVVAVGVAVVGVMVVGSLVQQPG